MNANSRKQRFTAASGKRCAILADGESGTEANKLGTFVGNAYTGAMMKPNTWAGNLVVDLDGVRIPAQQRPVLRQHDHEQIVGHTVSVKVEKNGPDKGIQISGVFSGESQHTDTVIVPARNGFHWQLSIGADPVLTEYLEAGEEAEVNGEVHRGPLTISRVTELDEISFVPLGADGNTSAKVTASRKGAKMNAKAMLKLAGSRYSDEQIDKMSDDKAKTALKKCMKAADEDSDVDADEDSDVDADEDSDVDADEDSDVDADEDSDVDADDDSDVDDGKAKAKSGKSKNRIGSAINRGLKAARSMAAREFRRQNEIAARCSKLGGNLKIVVDGGNEVDLLPYAIEKGWTPDKVELHAMRSQRPTVGTGPHFYSPSSPVLNGAVLECAVFDALRGSFKLFDPEFYRVGDQENGGRRVPAHEERRISADLNARYPDQVRQAAHTHFRGRIGLQQLLTMLAASNGYRGPATFNDPSSWGEVAAHLGGSIRADGPSTINVPSTLANVQNKFLLQGYLYAEQAYLDICSVLPVKDLKPTKSVQLFGDFQFQPLSPSGEIQHATVGDNPYANQANLQARMLTLDVQYIINDDLNAFGQIPMMLGRGWGLRVNDLVWSKFMSPGTDEGGSTNFFATSHTLPAGQKGNANLLTGSGSAVSDAALRLAKALIDKQVDPAGFPLGMSAEIILYPPELYGPVYSLFNSAIAIVTGLASTSAGSLTGNQLPWSSLFKPVMSRYLSNSNYTGNSTTKWYLLMNPSVIPTVQIAALNGQMTPQIQSSGQDWQFNTLGISMRGWGGVGVAMQNFRGAVACAGA